MKTVYFEIPKWFNGTISIYQHSVNDNQPFLIYNYHGASDVLSLDETITTGEGCKGLQPIGIKLTDKNTKEIKEQYKIFIPFSEKQTNTDVFLVFLKRINDLGMLDGLKYIRDLNDRITNGKVIVNEEFNFN